MRVQGPRVSCPRGVAARRQVHARAGWNLSPFKPANTTETPTQAPSSSNGSSSTHVATDTKANGALPANQKTNVKQKLDPLTSQDEEERRTCTSRLLPSDEEQEVRIRDNVTYRPPKSSRRKPGNAFFLAWANFVDEFKGLTNAAVESIAQPEDPYLPEAFGFTLSNDAIHEFDREHPAPGREPTPGFIKLAYSILLFFVDKVYEGRAIERFWFLETVARMPYFSYTTALHLYESLGWWRTGGLRLVHFAEEWNELHHLLIMEALGGDRRWQDRFLGQHAAIMYYWALVVCYLISPKWSYKFSEMLETHAVSTYRQFIIENGDKLRRLPAPKIAKSYYLAQDRYLFDMDSAFCRGPSGDPPRDPPCNSLYDVFVNILEDEWEHVKTMVMCQDYELLESLKVTQTEFDTKKTHEEDTAARRKVWNQWAKDLNTMDEMIEVRKM